ncbi:MAG: hypothetical protein Ta2G_00230 [Termitinemataceae bacterium]|nr:MAG: hypothetical protein Ta2G_00230 [Termitinemataceae bacterium]
MKKCLGLAAALFVFAAAQSYSLGIGVEFNGGWNGGVPTYAPTLLLSPDDKNHIGIDFNLGYSGFAIGVHYDWWGLNDSITSVGSGSLDFFLGPGAEVGLLLFDGFGLTFAVRGVAGLDLKFKRFDIYLQAVPKVGFRLAIPPAFRFHWGVDGALGARFWFGK